MRRIKEILLSILRYFQNKSQYNLYIDAVLLLQEKQSTILDPNPYQTWLKSGSNQNTWIRLDPGLQPWM